MLARTAGLHERHARCRLSRQRDGLHSTDQVLTRQPASARSTLKAAEELGPLNPFVLFTGQRILAIDPAFSCFTDPLVYAYGAFHRWKDCVARYSAVQAGAGTTGGQDYMAAT
jgi:hypothetical protein